MIDIEWDSQHRHRRKPPSRMHAIWNQFRGRIMGNTHLIHKGEKESRRLASYKRSLHEANARKTAHRHARDARKRRTHPKTGLFSSIHLPFFNKRHYKARYYTDGTVELHERSHPYLHYHHRTQHPHSGFQYRVMGFLKADPGMRDRGKGMRDVARRERTIARRRRRRELKQFGHAMRTKHRY